MTRKYKNIVVPLDGSNLAETALDDATSLALIYDATVTLVQVVQLAEHVIGLDTPYPMYLDQQWENQKVSALNYLKDIQRNLAKLNIPVNISVEIGDAAEAIIEYTNKNDTDLVVMATHGRTGLQRWVYGSVADKVLRGAEVPVLLVRAYAKKREKAITT